MTGPERATLDRLELRLFGEDGTGGALGSLSHDVKDLVIRVGTLEARNKTQDAVAAATAAHAAAQTASQLTKRDEVRWRVGILSGLIGSVVGAMVYAIVDIARQVHG